VIGISSELAYLILFGLALLVRYLWQQRGKVHRWEEALARTPRTQAEVPDEVPQPAPSAALPERARPEWLHVERPPTGSSPTPAATRPTRGRPGLERPGVPPERPGVRRPRRFSREALFGDRRRTQDAIVAAVILGPCRSDAPHDAGR
jgi:hypothetical protein